MEDNRPTPGSTPPPLTPGQVSPVAPGPVAPAPAPPKNPQNKRAWIIGGAIADRYGNLAYRGTMRNFNPLIAMASSIAVADPVETVAVLDPERIVTPYPLVDYVLKEENGQ
ncbi:MAG TPA: CoA-transferase [Bacillota bacterium]|nr:CoA-transferase [Bacillota bacterium]